MPRPVVGVEESYRAAVLAGARRHFARSAGYVGAVGADGTVTSAVLWADGRLPRALRAAPVLRAGLVRLGPGGQVLGGLETGCDIEFWRYGRELGADPAHLTVPGTRLQDDYGPALVAPRRNAVSEVLPTGAWQSAAVTPPYPAAVTPPPSGRGDPGPPLRGDRAAAGDGRGGAGAVGGGTVPVGGRGGAGAVGGGTVPVRAGGEQPPLPTVPTGQSPTVPMGQPSAAPTGQPAAVPPEQFPAAPTAQPPATPTAQAPTGLAPVPAGRADVRGVRRARYRPGLLPRRRRVHLGRRGTTR